jgi:hypothetical protein
MRRRFNQGASISNFDMQDICPAHMFDCDCLVVETDDQRAHDALIELQLALKLFHRGGFAREVHRDIVAFTKIVDLVGETTTAKGLDLLDNATELGELVGDALNGGLNFGFFEGGLDDVRDLVGGHYS